MKDAISCEKLRVGANSLRTGDIRMGQPTQQKAVNRILNKIGIRRQTQGTETSKYLEEEKETSIS